jgi:hypothetical protein
MPIIQKHNFTVDAETNLITFDKNADVELGSLLDGDVVYLQQGLICLDAMLCYFDTRENLSPSESEEYTMFQIDVYKYVGEANHPAFCNASHTTNVPQFSELEVVDTIYVYVDDLLDSTKFDIAFQRYTEQMHKLIAKYSLLKSI